MKGGRFLGEGSYGCVVKPAIPCHIKYKKISSNKKITLKIGNKHTKHGSVMNTNSNSSSLTKTNKDSISKIIISPDADFKQEVNISYKISKLDPL